MIIALNLLVGPNTTLYKVDILFLKDKEVAPLLKVNYLQA